MYRNKLLNSSHRLDPTQEIWRRIIKPRFIEKKKSVDGEELWRVPSLVSCCQCVSLCCNCVPCENSYLLPPPFFLFCFWVMGGMWAGVKGPRTHTRVVLNLKPTTTGNWYLPICWTYGAWNSEWLNYFGMLEGRTKMAQLVRRMLKLKVHLRQYHKRHYS